jgi:hypothetical protein
MTEPIIDRLRAALVDTADAAPLRGVSPDAVIARARSARRRRQTFTAVAVAAGVAAIVLASAVLAGPWSHGPRVQPAGPRPTPSQTDEGPDRGAHNARIRAVLAGLPVGPAPRTDLVVEARLQRTSGKAYELPAVSAVPGETRLQVTEVPGGWVVVDEAVPDGEVNFVSTAGATRLLDRGPEIGAVVSPDGRQVVVYHLEKAGGQVRILDPRTGAKLYQDIFRPTADAFRFHYRPMGWAGSTVLLVNPGTGGECPCPVSVWDPAKGPWVPDTRDHRAWIYGPVDSSGRQLAFVSDSPGSNDGCFVVLDPARGFAQTKSYCGLRLDPGSFGSVSPGGRYLTGLEPSPTATGRFVVADLRHPATDAPVRMGIPQEMVELLRLNTIAWEDERTVLLTPDWDLPAGSTPVALIRCRVDTGRCERAPVTVTGPGRITTVGRP